MLPELNKLPNELIKQFEDQHQEYLNHVLRYNRFRQGESKQEWVELLGPDVLLATHSLTAFELVIQFILFTQEQGKPLDQESIILLLTAAKSHDWGEIIIEDYGVGDISFDQKTPEDELVEIDIFEKVCALLPQGTDLDLIKQAYYQVAQNKEGLGEIFNVVERAGYWQTALRAYLGVNNERIKNWQGLVGNVFSNQTEKLLDYAKKYAFVSQILADTQQDISMAFSQIMFSREVPLDKDGNLSYDLKKLTRAYKAWLAYLRDLKRTPTV